MQDKPKPLSGAQIRKRRVERGLPQYTPADIEWRRRYDRMRGPRNSPSQIAYQQRRHRANSQFVAALKIQMGCTDCGYRGHPEALDFDHLPGFTKKCGVSQMMTRSRKDILAEIAKCECVCANCHRIRTARRRAEARELAASLGAVSTQLSLM